MRKYLQPVLMFAAIIAWPLGHSEAAESVKLRVICWNLESGDSDAELLGRQMGQKDEVDIWGLSEVDPDVFDIIEAGAEESGIDFETIEGETGGNDRLAILFNTDRLELLEVMELHAVRLGSQNLRAPLIAHFRGKATGIEFVFMVNHLLRGDGDEHDEERRLEQARLLNEWASVQTLPVILTGDLNADYDCQFGDAGQRAPLFDELIQDGHLAWVRPISLVRTQRSFNSVLDFVMVANPQALPGWSGASRVLNRAGDSVATTLTFQDNGEQTDHRPVDAVFSVSVPEPEDGPQFATIAPRFDAISPRGRVAGFNAPSTGGPAQAFARSRASRETDEPTLRDLLDRLEELESEVRALRAERRSRR